MRPINIMFEVLREKKTKNFFLSKRPFCDPNLRTNTGLIERVAKLKNRTSSESTTYICDVL
jgi:hypothetical protein